MKIIAKYDETCHPPLLSLFIHDAPHRRMHLRVIQQYRDHLRAACVTAGIATPIETPLDLSVLFVSPASPDMDNLLTALYQAMDGNTLRPPGILIDDSLIHKVTMSKLFPGGKKK